MCLNSLKKLAKSNAIFKALEKGDLNCFRQIVGKAKKTVELSNLRDRLGRTLLEFIISNHDLVRVSQFSERVFSKQSNTVVEEKFILKNLSFKFLVSQLYSIFHTSV